MEGRIPKALPVCQNIRYWFQNSGVGKHIERVNTLGTKAKHVVNFISHPGLLLSRHTSPRPQTSQWLIPGPIDLSSDGLRYHVLYVL